MSPRNETSTRAQQLYKQEPKRKTGGKDESQGSAAPAQAAPYTRVRGVGGGPPQEYGPCLDIGRRPTGAKEWQE